MNKLSELAQDVGISEEYLRNTNQWNLITELAERIVRECAMVALLEPYDPSEQIMKHFEIDQ